MNAHEFLYGIDNLSVAKAIAIASGRLTGRISAEAARQILASREAVASIVSEETTVYGINTGFGPLCDTRISEEDTRTLQYNLLCSHSTGVGDPVPPFIAKLMLITKVHALAQGFSGIAPATLERICWHIDQDIIPVVPEKGSVGASGDLAPLSHLFLPLIGLGEVYYKGVRTPAAAVLQQYQLLPVALGPKEGLALINGTQFILAFAASAVQRLHNALEAADIIGAMSLEAFMGSRRPFDARLHQLRAYQGTQLVAQRLHRLLEASGIINAHIDCERVQDPYSIRCMPQVHGASRNAWLHLKEMTTTELNAVTDNPIVLSAQDSISGGNFHGQPLALPVDYACLAAAELGNISDRRSYLLIEGKYGLPRLLIKDSGLNSGFMIPQYTAAALVTENKTMCFPASADSVPTSLGQEDHVSMGAWGARKLHRVIDNVEYILAVELMYAAQGLDFRRPLKSGPVLEACHGLVRSKVTHAAADRIFAADMEALRQLIASGDFVAEADAVAREQGGVLNEGWAMFGLD